ncbi:disks large-associated protein 5 [Lasius niger]|uniref:Disks large-associated protein 5 n=1 Tax=Lasius niger TaxID=67767 RepID=A0A0J7JWX3_LASNI|nr:disks large-associated protein 5 [Lasius niger]
MMTPRRSVSKKENKTPVKSSRKSLLKSSQKDVNKYMTPNKGNITGMENTILIENVDKKRRSSRKSVAFSAEACVACAENKPVLPMTPHSKRNRSKTPSRQSRSKHAFNEDLIAWNTPEPLPNRVTRSHQKN